MKSEEDIKLHYITPAIQSKGWRDHITMETAIKFTDGKINLRGNFIHREKLFAEVNVHTIIRMLHSVFAPYTSITTNILFFEHTGPTKETWFYRLDMPDGYKNFSKTKPMKQEHFAPAMEWWNNRRELLLMDLINQRSIL